MGNIKVAGLSKFLSLSLSLIQCWKRLVLAALVLPPLASCADSAQEMSVNLVYEVPEMVDATELGDLDWYFITSDNLDAAEVVAFDQKAQTRHIQRVTATVSGDKSLAYSAVVPYKWTDGERHRSLDEVGSALTMQGKDEDGSKGQFVITVVVPEKARRIVIHGSCWRGFPTIHAQIEKTNLTTSLNCDVEGFPNWTYELALQNAGGKTATITIKSTSNPDFASSITISGALVSSKPPEWVERESVAHTKSFDRDPIDISSVPMDVYAAVCSLGHPVLVFGKEYDPIPRFVAFEGPFSEPEHPGQASNYVYFALASLDDSSAADRKLTASIDGFRKRAVLKDLTHFQLPMIEGIPEEVNSLRAVLGNADAEHALDDGGRRRLVYTRRLCIGTKPVLGAYFDVVNERVVRAKGVANQERLAKLVRGPER